MSEQYQSLIRKTREVITPWLLAPTLATGVTADFWSHPNENTRTEFWAHLLAGGRADITRRTAIASIPNIGPMIADHIGNFGYSAALMIPITTLGYAIKEYGKSNDSKVIEMIGEITPVIGILGIIAINFAAEEFSPDNVQMMGDLIFGLGGIALAHYTTTGTLDRYSTKINQSKAPISVLS